MSIREAAAASKEQAMGATKDQKTIVVTGGNGGLGYECAKVIAASSLEWRVVLAVRGPEKDEDAFALRDAAAVDVDVVTGDAHAGLHGAVVP